MFTALLLEVVGVVIIFVSAVFQGTDVKIDERKFDPKQKLSLVWNNGAFDAKPNDMLTIGVVDVDCIEKFIFSMQWKP